MGNQRGFLSIDQVQREFPGEEVRVALQDPFLVRKSNKLGSSQIFLIQLDCSL